MYGRAGAQFIRNKLPQPNLLIALWSVQPLHGWGWSKKASAPPCSIGILWPWYRQMSSDYDHVLTRFLASSFYLIFALSARSDWIMLATIGYFYLVTITVATHWFTDTTVILFRFNGLGERTYYDEWDASRGWDGSTSQRCAKHILVNWLLMHVNFSRGSQRPWPHQ